MQPVVEPNENCQDRNQNQKPNANQVASMIERENMMNHNTVNTAAAIDGEGNENGTRNGNDSEHPNIDSKMIDLNTRPARPPGQTSNTQVLSFFGIEYCSILFFCDFLVIAVPIYIFLDKDSRGRPYERQQLGLCRCGAHIPGRWK
jgi:hypothetical protein